MCIFSYIFLFSSRRLYFLQWGKTFPCKKEVFCVWYQTASDREALTLEIWGSLNTPSISSPVWVVFFPQFCIIFKGILHFMLFKIMMICICIDKTESNILVLGRVHRCYTLIQDKVTICTSFWRILSQLIKSLIRSSKGRIKKKKK